MQSGRCAMALLARADLGKHVADHRPGPEAAVCGDGDRPRPGPDHQQDQRDPPGPAEALHPGGLAVPAPEAEQRQGRDQGTDRSLEQDGDGHAGPEHRPGAGSGDPLAPARCIDFGQGGHHQGDRPAERRVGLGDEALGREDQAGAEQRPRHRPAGGAEESRRAPGAGGGRRHGAQQRGDAVGPDPPRLHPRQGSDARRLQPVDAHRLLEAWGVLQVDRDQVSGLQHLGGRLGEASLVAVQHGDADQPRQGGQQGHRRCDQRGAPASGEKSLDGGFVHRRFDSTLAASGSAI